MIYGLDGKILHLKEMQFIEKMLFDTLLDPKDFYTGLEQFFKENLLDTKTSFTTRDLDKIDFYVKEYFATRIEISKIWLVRAYVTGRLLVISDLMQTPFEIASVNRLPKFVEDAARKYGLTLEEALALKQAVEEGASLMSNTTVNTIQNVREALIENTKSGKGVQGFYDKIRSLVKDEVGELNRNWQRVAITEANSAFNNGYLSQLNEGDYVVGVSMPDACEHCLNDINGRVFKVRKEPAPDYSTMTGENYWKWAEVWENEVWVGKNNFGRSSSARKRIDPTKGNREENLREKDHHEYTMPAIPYHPNCFTGDVEIYTKKGWQRFDSLERKLPVATFNLQTQALEYQLPEEYIEYDYTGKMIRLFAKNIDITMTSKHNVIVGKRYTAKDRTAKRFSLVPADNLNGELNIPIVIKYDNNTQNPIQIGHHIIDEITYANLLGYYLSEGSTRSNKYGWEVKISQEKINNNIKIYNDLLPLGIKLRKYKGSIEFNDKDICQYLKKFGKSYEKYIPDEVKNLSKNGIRTFLEAYLLGDGNIKVSKSKLRGQINPSISKTISTSSKKIADDLAEIILKAGYSVSYGLQKTKGKTVKFKNGNYIINHDVWIISIKTSKQIQVAKKEEFEYNGKVYCVSVPNQTILVRSNGKVLFIGNCRDRWIKINPEYQYVDKDGQIRLRVENEDSWQNWYNENIEQ